MHHAVFYVCLSSCTDCSRCRWHTHLTIHGYFDYLCGKKTWRSPIWDSCRNKNGAGSGISLVYLCYTDLFTDLFILFSISSFYQLKTVNRVLKYWSHIIFRVSIFSQLRILAHLLGSFHPDILLDVVSPLITHGGAIGVNLSRSHQKVTADSE